MFEIEQNAGPAWQESTWGRRAILWWCHERRGPARKHRTFEFD
jgi:hypothetical protein